MFLSMILRVFLIMLLAGGASAALAAEQCSLVCSLYEKSSVSNPLKILIVPGHEPSSGGSWFRGYTERDINLLLAEDIIQLLRVDPKIEVLTTRTASGWTSTLSQYFRDAVGAIADFRSSHIESMAREYESGMTTRHDSGVGSQSDLATSLRLFGINKWANENDVDMIINLHVNDYSGRPTTQIGVYEGLVIFVPERQYLNAPGSLSLARSLYSAINTLIATSTRPQERAGIVEDQDLTALGAHRTLVAPSVLIEYGYIYEGAYRNQSVRGAFVQDLARMTVRGLYDAFGVSTSSVSSNFIARGLPKKGEQSSYIYEIQRTLAERGLYPPPGSSLTACPFSGIFGTCTYRSLLGFQKSLGFPGTELRVETIQALERGLAPRITSR